MKLHRYAVLMVAVAMFISAFAGIFSVDGGVAQSPTQEAGEVTVTLNLQDIFFDPTVIEIPPNQDVRLRIVNSDAALHSFVVPDLGIDVEVQPGRSGEITLNAEMGEYEFICTVPGHMEAGMVGTLRVLESFELESTDSSTPSATGEWSFPGLSAQDLLPEAEELGGPWAVEDEGVRSEAEMARPFGSSGQALLDRWGWKESVYRDFTRQTPEQFEDPTTALSVSIHAFDTSEGAAAAFEPFSEYEANAYELVDRPEDALGENARLLSGFDDGSNLSILYVQAGNFLIRVGASSESGDPSEMAGKVAEIILAKGTQSPADRAETAVAAIETTSPQDRTPTPQISAVATASPEASPVVALDEPGCEGLASYSRLVLAIETDTWNQLVAEFGIDEETDLSFLELEQYAVLATLLDAQASMLSQAEPPAFAEDWHQNRVASVQLRASLARLVPQAGNFFAARLMHWEMSEILDDQQRLTYLDAVAECPAFETFWVELDLIDGEEEDPPAPEPDYSVCPGLERYDSDIDRAFVQSYANHPDLAEEFFGISETSEDDLHALSPIELLMLAEMFREISGELATISAPDYAIEWHLMLFLSFGAAAGYFEAAAAHGFETADAELGMGIAGLLMDEAAEKATEECSVFAEFAAS